MRNRFARACTVLAAGAAVTSVIGFSAATAASASTVGAKPNATPACGSSCQDFSSKILGPHTILNAYVPGDTGTGARPGQIVNMKYASNSHPNEDFQVENVGTVGDYCKSFFNPDGILPSNGVACQDFFFSPVYELNFAPFGNQTGLCAGTSGTPYDGLTVRLVTCGTTQGSMIIQGPSTGPYNTYISGATTQFSHPYVFTVNPGTSNPANQIQLRTENTLTGGVPSDNQLFRFSNGPVL